MYLYLHLQVNHEKLIFLNVLHEISFFKLVVHIKLIEIYDI